MRGLQEGFMLDLSQGVLSALLERVRGDHTLDLQIRENYVNVYYRGGSLVCARSERAGGYTFAFNTQYLDFPGAPASTGVAANTSILSAEDCAAWMGSVPLLKDVMDRWFAFHPWREREVQQLLTRENTWDAAIAGGTDFFVCDLEYVRNGGRADIVGVHWPSTGHARKRRTGHRLAFAELKYGDSALSGDCGLLGHVRGVEALAADARVLDEIKHEMVGVFGQKHRLGLVRTKHVLDGFSDEPPEMLIVIANHDPESTRLRRELEAVANAQVDLVEVRVGHASAFGYGLYDDFFMDVATYLARFPS